MNTTTLKNQLIENDVVFTDNIDEAIYILPDGSLIDGVFDYGSRSEDHRMIEIVMESDRYDDNFWDDVHDIHKLVRLVPETRYALIKVGQQLTEAQRVILSTTDYEIEEY